MNIEKQLPNQLEVEACEYLRKHRIAELFEDLCTAVCFKKPKIIKEFLKEQLLLKQKSGFKTGIFEEQEIDNIFTLFDLKKDGVIERETCKQALKTFASSELQWSEVDEKELPEKITKDQFKDLVKKFFFDYNPENHIRKHQGQKLSVTQVEQTCEKYLKQKNIAENAQIPKQDLLSYTLEILKNGGFPHINSAILQNCLKEIGLAQQAQYTKKQFITYMSYCLQKIEKTD